LINCNIIVFIVIAIKKEVWDRVDPPDKPGMFITPKAGNQNKVSKHGKA